MSDEPEAPLLFAYDGSDCAKRAIVRAGELFTARRAVVLSVAPAAPPAGIGSGPALDALDQGADEESLKLAEQGAALAAEQGFTAEPEIIRSEPIWQGILDRAEAIGVTAIVVGSKGRTGLAYVMLGSVATAVSQRARESVLIVH